MFIDTNLIIYGDVVKTEIAKKSFISLDTIEYGLVQISIGKKILNSILDRLIGVVGINITAKQNLTTKKLHNIKFISITDYSEIYDPEKMEKLIEEGTKAWKDVKNIDEWLRDIRG